MSAPPSPRRRLILVGGGARSGKSAFALDYARQLAAAGARPLFVATAQPFDGEMTARIDHHREERGASFDTTEEPLRVAAAIAAADSGRVVLVDCLTLWLSNLLLAEASDDEILRQVNALAEAAAARPGPTLLVTNEVGLGLVPESALGRRFRDLAGGAHQRLAAIADEVYAALMGMVLRLHPGPITSFRRGELP